MLSSYLVATQVVDPITDWQIQAYIYKADVNLEMVCVCVFSILVLIQCRHNLMHAVPSSTVAMPT